MFQDVHPTLSRCLRLIPPATPPGVDSTFGTLLDVPLGAPSLLVNMIWGRWNPNVILRSLSRDTLSEQLYLSFFSSSLFFFKTQQRVLLFFGTNLALVF